jgi:HlyD family secretion protein
MIGGIAMKPRRLLLIIGGLVLLAVILCVGSGLASRIKDRISATPTLEAEEEPPAEVSVRARGEVVPAVWADLSFETAGTVAEWFVEEGEVVEAATPLGRLDTQALELALKQAQATLETAEVKLAQAEEENEHQLAKAELAFQTAEDRLAQAEARFPQATTAEVTLKQAHDALVRAQEAYDKAWDQARDWEMYMHDPTPRFPGENPPTGTSHADRLEADRESTERALENAQYNLEVAQAEYDAVLGERQASGKELSVLETEVKQAQLDLEQLQEGVDPLLVQEVKNARLQVEQAQADLEAGTLVAPFGGTVVKLHLPPHDQAAVGAPAVTLADLSTLRVETTDLDEWGAAQIDVGSEVEIVFNAFDDKTLTGHVTETDLRGETLPAGDVVYRTIVELDELDPDLRWGMTVRISIPLEE